MRYLTKKSEPALLFCSLCTLSASFQKVIHPLRSFVQTKSNSRFYDKAFNTFVSTPTKQSTMNDVNDHYDLFVIGAGSGGIACAKRAAQYGKKVGIAEANRLGGTCVNVGCVPKKVMWNCANLYSGLKDLQHYGITLDRSSVFFNWADLKNFRDMYIKRLNGLYEKSLKEAGVTIYHAKATIDQTRQIRLERVDSTVTQVTANHILITTGSVPTKLGVKGEEHVIDSNGFFELEHQPKRVAIIGAGYIAVELAGVLHALGTDTHIFIRGGTVLRKFDAVLSETLTDSMKKQGIHIHAYSILQKVEVDELSGLKAILLENGERFSDFDCVICAVGREPNIAFLDPSSTLMKTDTSNRNCIPVNDYQETECIKVYALGDVCRKVELTPMAIAAGRRLADRLFGGITDAKADYNMFPSVIFSHPPIGTVGLTELEAKEKYGAERIEIFCNSCVNLYYGTFSIPSDSKPVSHFKLVCLKGGRILGAHVIGMGADEMIQGFGVAIKMGATKRDFDNCLAVHPTAAEEFVTMHPWGLDK